MEHDLFPLEFQLPDGKGTLQTAQKCCQLKRHSPNCTKMLSIKNSVIFQMLSAVYPALLLFDMGTSYTPIFISESVVYKIINSRFQ